jgi:hypothetical protein
MAHVFPNYIESSMRSNQPYRENYGTTQTSCSIIFTLRKRYKKTCAKELDLTRSDRADNHAIEDNRTWQRAKTAARTKEKQKKRRKNSGETGQRGSEEEVKRKRTGEEQQRRASGDDRHRWCWCSRVLCFLCLPPSRHLPCLNPNPKFIQDVQMDDWGYPQSVDLLSMNHQHEASKKSHHEDVAGSSNDNSKMSPRFFDFQFCDTKFGEFFPKTLAS